MKPTKILSRIFRRVALGLLAMNPLFVHGQKPVDMMFLSNNHCMLRVSLDGKYLLLPVEERAEMSNIKVLIGSYATQTLNVRLATDYVDYYVPLDLSAYQGKSAVLDIHVNGNIRNEGAIKGFICWKEIKVSNVFDKANRERLRPVYHHSPAYGWMNDPNGMFYKDGIYHLYYQFNPYGSQWENMHWGHSTSRNLIDWTDEGIAISPDALGTVFSGSAVVDKNNTAGFGAGAIVAMYTSAGESQTQSLAYSTDDGKTFVKYDRNPVITADVPDFRDPHMFWYEPTKRWIVILAAGQEMRLYSSVNLKDWTYESSFGQEYGNHEGVWECPDLMQLPVRNTDKQKWMLICNINPGGPFGGNATQYFTGYFDGHRFVCESEPQVTKWMDYGKDHYAAVTFDNAPNNRRIIMAWMSNWQYANQVPTKQYRNANTLPRDLYLYEYQGETYVGIIPSPELLALRGKAIAKDLGRGKKTFSAGNGAYEIVTEIKSAINGRSIITLQNGKGEAVSMTYDVKAGTFAVDRTKSGDTSFNESFSSVTVAPVRGKLSTLRIFVDKSSIEVLDAEGRLAITNTVFPSEPYNVLIIDNEKGNKTAATIYNITK